MQKKQQKFAESIRCEDAQKAQDEIAQESIKRELFKILVNSDIENGKKLELEQVVDLVVLELGLNSDREQLKNYIKKTIQSGKYKYKIDKDGHITQNFNKLAEAQKKHSDRESEIAKQTLLGFVQKVEMHAKNLQSKNTALNEKNLKSQFSEEELENNRIWINLAVAKFLTSQNQER